MGRTIVKGQIGIQDLALGTSTFTRATSVGGSQVLNQISAATINGTQTANTVLAGPASGAPGQSTFRALVAADLPVISLAFGNVVTGTNTSAAMTVGSGASIVPASSGVIEATQLQGVAISTSAPSVGQILVATSTASATWQSPSLSVVTATSTPTNFNAAIGATNILTNAAAGVYHIGVYIVQTQLGVGWSSASNTVSVALIYTDPTGTVHSSSNTIINFTITGNGAVGSTPAIGGLLTFALALEAGSSLQFSTSVGFNSTGGSTLPQYQIFAKVIF